MKMVVITYMCILHVYVHVRFCTAFLLICRPPLRMYRAYLWIHRVYLRRGKALVVSARLYDADPSCVLVSEPHFFGVILGRHDSWDLSVIVLIRLSCQTHTSTHLCIQQTDIHAHMWTHTYTSTYMHAYLQTCINTYILIYIHTYIHTNIHAHMQT